MAVHIRSFFHVLYGMLNELCIDLREVTMLLFEQVYTRRSQRAVGNRRSLVRMIASRLPRRPAQRCHFTVIEECKVSLVQCDLQNCEATATPSLRIDFAGSNTVVGGIKNGLVSSTDTGIGDLDDVAEFSQGLALASIHSSNTSTPVHQCCLHSRCATFVNELSRLNDRQILSLEMELARLRGNKYHDFNSIIPAPAKKSVPPPPPPPPPPPLPPQLIFTLKNTAPNNVQNNNNVLKPYGVTTMIDMAELLSDMKNVKLRQTEKSPGGTPVRPKFKPVDPNDPATIIALALKKRFTSLPVMEESCESLESSAPDDTWNSTNSTL